MRSPGVRLAPVCGKPSSLQSCFSVLYFVLIDVLIFLSPVFQLLAVSLSLGPFYKATILVIRIAKLGSGTMFTRIIRELPGLL